MKNSILAQDLEIGIDKLIEITPQFIKYNMEKRHAGDAGDFGECLRIAADFTALTRREISFIVYSNFPTDPEKYRSIRALWDSWELFRIVTPSIGDKKSVPDPKLCREIYKDELRIGEPEGEDLYLPIFHLHTHPNSYSYPSEADLINAMERYESEFSLGNIRLNVRNQTINVINNNDGCVDFGTRVNKDSQFFYQFTGDLEKFGQFMESYKKTIDMAFDKASKFPEKVMAQEMEKSGAFKAVAYPRGSLMEVLNMPCGILYTFKKPVLKKLGNKFAWTIHAKRFG